MTTVTIFGQATPEVKKKPIEYFHELSQSKVEELISNRSTWGDIMANYQQPDWCSYPEALKGEYGCWSLTDLTKKGTRQIISKDFCKDYECFCTKNI